MSKEKASTIWVALGFSVAFFFLWTVSHELSNMREVRYPLYFDWETAIPFQWWAVPIYFSLDIIVTLFALFFRNWKEAIPPVATVTIQTAIAVPVFVLLPITVGYQNDLQGGVWGELLFSPMNAPNISLWNHVPSLHVAYAFTIAWIIGKRSGKFWMFLCMLWAVVISISTMLVHEHHLICLIGGFTLFVATITTVYPYLQRKFQP